jgi:hypothetical protein
VLRRFEDYKFALGISIQKNFGYVTKPSYTKLVSMRIYNITTPQE